MPLIGGASGASCDTSGPEAFAGFGCQIAAISMMSIGGASIFVGTIVFASATPLRRRLRLSVVPTAERDGALGVARLTW